MPSRDGASSARGGFRGISILLVVSLFLVVAATNILTPLLPEVRDDFGVSIATIGLVVGAFGLARLVVDLPAGWLIERIGHRQLSIIALVLLVAASLAGLVAPTLEVLILSRIGAGLAVAILATVLLAGLAATAGEGNRAKVLGLFPTANNASTAFYPLLGAVVGALIGWRATFAVTADPGGRRRRDPAAAAPADRPPAAPESRAADRPGRCSRPPRAAAGDRHRGDRDRCRGDDDPPARLPEHGPAALRGDRPRARRALDRHGDRADVDHGPCGQHPGRRTERPDRATPGHRDRHGRPRRGRPRVPADERPAVVPHRRRARRPRRLLPSSQTAVLSEIVPPELRTRVLSGYRFSVDLGAFIGPILLALVMDLTSADAAIVLVSVLLVGAAVVARLGLPASADLVGPGVVDEAVPAGSD